MTVNMSTPVMMIILMSLLFLKTSDIQIYVCKALISIAVRKHPCWLC